MECGLLWGFPPNKERKDWEEPWLGKKIFTFGLGNFLLRKTRVGLEAFKIGGFGKRAKLERKVIKTFDWIGLEKFSFP